MTRYPSILLSAVVLLAIPMPGSAQSVGSSDIENDAVRSRHIRKDSVKSSDIAKGAVRSSDIRDGGIKTKDLADESVSTDKISSGAVTKSEIADGAVTADKLDASLLAGLANVIYVAKSGGDFDDPRTALQSIADAAESNRYLVFIAPGVYDLGSTPVQLIPFVSIVGSGEGTTILQGNVPSASGGISNGLLMGDDNVALQGMTVRNLSNLGSSAIFNSGVNLKLRHMELITAGGGLGSKVGLWNESGGFIEITHVTAKGLGPAGMFGFCTGLWVRNSSALVRNSELIGDGCAISHGVVVDDGGFAAVQGSEIVGKNATTGAISVALVSDDAGERSEIAIHHSHLSGSVFGGSPGDAGISTVKIANSQIDGSIAKTPSTEVICVNAYGENFVALGTDCEAPTSSSP